MTPSSIPILTDELYTGMPWTASSRLRAQRDQGSYGEAQTCPWQSVYQPWQCTFPCTTIPCSTFKHQVCTPVSLCHAVIRPVTWPLDGGSNSGTLALVVVV